MLLPVFYIENCIFGYKSYFENKRKDVKKWEAK